MPQPYVAPSPILADIVAMQGAGLLPSLTAIAWASRPNAAAYAGCTQYISDIAPNGGLFRSDGVNWLPSSGVQRLASVGIPVLVPPVTGTNTISAGGLITLTGITLPNNYTNGLWIHLLAGDVVGGATGLYYAVQTSNTTNATFQVYTNYQAPNAAFVPYVPTGTLVNAVGSGAALGDTSGVDRTLCNLVIPGGFLAPNGTLSWTAGFSNSSAATTKQLKATLGGAALINVNNSGQPGAQMSTSLANVGSAASQTIRTAGNGNSSPGYTAVDTTVNQTFALIAQIASATKNTDWALLTALQVIATPAS